MLSWVVQDAADVHVHTIITKAPQQVEMGVLIVVVVKIRQAVGLRLDFLTKWRMGDE